MVSIAFTDSRGTENRGLQGKLTNVKDRK